MNGAKNVIFLPFHIPYPVSDLLDKGPNEETREISPFQTPLPPFQPSSHPKGRWHGCSQPPNGVKNLDNIAINRV